MSFNFTIEPYPRDQKGSVSLMGWEVDLYSMGDAGRVLMGRMIADRSEPVRLLERYGFNLRRCFYLRSDELLDRYELIAIRIPISSSHLHKPFSDAVGKIREAEVNIVFVKGADDPRVAIPV